MNTDLLSLIGFFVGGVIIAVVCNILLLRFAKSLGIRNKNDVVVRWSNESKPSLGGVSFFVVFVFAAIVYAVLAPDNENVFQNVEFIGLFLGGALAFIMGLSDDAYNTRPMLKLLAQIFCGVLLCVSGTVIDFSSFEFVNWILTISWVVIVMNSLNMLDNMDGITGTTVFFILGSCIFSMVYFGVIESAVWMIMLVAVLGSVVGFLSMNIHPSKLFMGDAGSQFIGLFVAFFSVKYLLNIGHLQTGDDFPIWIGLFITLIAFTGAASDTLTVVINRLKKGTSPMVGGKDHTTHHLVYKGLSDIQVWQVFLIIGFLSSSLTVVCIKLLSVGLYYLIPVVSLFSVIIFIILYRNTVKYLAPKQ